MELPSLSTELRKLLLRLTLACFSRKLVQKQIGCTSRIDSYSIEMGVVCPKVGVASKISRARFAHNHTIGTPLQEILDPPLLSAS